MSSVSSMTFGPSYCRKGGWNFKFYKHQWERRWFFCSFFSNQEVKLFIIVHQPLTPLPEEKPVLNHFQVHTFVCLFVFLSRSVSETNRSDDRLFSWGEKRKHWGMSQGWLKCYRCYLAHVIRGKGVNADFASVSQWTSFNPESQLMLSDGGLAQSECFR